MMTPRDALSEHSFLPMFCLPPSLTLALICFDCFLKFSGSSHFGKRYRDRYWKQEAFQSLETIAAACKKHSISTTESALRWMYKHSALKDEFGDGVILGGLLLLPTKSTDKKYKPKTTKNQKKKQHTNCSLDHETIGRKPRRHFQGLRATARRHCGGLQ